MSCPRLTCFHPECWYMRKRALPRQPWPRELTMCYTDLQPYTDPTTSRKGTP